MKTTRIAFALAILQVVWLPLRSQDLEDLLKAQDTAQKLPVEALFKTTRLVTGHAAKQMKAGELDFRISHRFGRLDSGAYEFFGLDQSNIHLSLEYGIFDWLMAGIGRGTYGKTVDGFLKFNLANQETGPGAFWFTIDFLSTMEINALKWTYPDRPNYFSSRLSYAHQLLVARKLGNATLQLMPILVHRNLVPTKSDRNDLFALGFGGRYKLAKRIAVSGEYYHVFRPVPQPLGIRYYNPLSFGVDIQTGGHVFQILLSNSQGMREGQLIGATTGRWMKGDIYLGFNISRVFTLK